MTAWEFLQQTNHLGIRYAPCQRNNKKLRSGWNSDTATSDTAKLEEFRGGNFHCWSGPLEGSDRLWGTLDFDVKDGKKGDETFLALVAVNGPPPPSLWHIQTPSGGFHYSGFLRRYRSWTIRDVDAFTSKPTGHWMAPCCQIEGKEYMFVSGDMDNPAYLDDWISRHDIAEIDRLRQKMKEESFHRQATWYAGILAGRGYTDLVPHLEALEALHRIDMPEFRELKRNELRDIEKYGIENPITTFDDTLPKVYLKHLVIEMAHDTWEALQEANDPPRLFQFATIPHRVDTNGQLAMLTQPKFTHELNRMIQFVRVDQYGYEYRANCPGGLVGDMLAAPEFPLPELNRVVTSPVFGPDGCLINEPGFHEDGGIYFAGEPVDLVPLSMDEAKALILEWLNDFPFEAGADRANAIAFLLTPIVRDMITGLVPLFLAEAPTPGTGKGLLLETSMLINGSGYSLMTQPEDSDETRKRITSIMREAGDVILLDNIAEGIDSAELAAVLTAEYWSDRILGRNETIRIRNRKVWAASGNNISLSLELARRTVRIRLVPDVEQPWNKTDFLHPNLALWVEDNRTRLLSACISIVQSWISAGQPRGTESMGSYMSFTKVLGGILQHARIEGFITNQRKLFDSTVHEHEKWHYLCATWAKEIGTSSHVTAKMVMDIAQRIEGFDFPQRTEVGQAVAMGKQLRKAMDAIYDGWQIVAEAPSEGSARFSLREVGSHSKEAVPIAEPAYAF